MFIKRYITYLKRWWFYHRNKRSHITTPTLLHSVDILMITSSVLLKALTPLQRRKQTFNVWVPKYYIHINQVQEAINVINTNGVFKWHYPVVQYSCNLDEFMTDPRDVPLDLDHVQTRLLEKYQELYTAIQQVENTATLDYYTRLTTYLIKDAVVITEALMNATITHA